MIIGFHKPVAKRMEERSSLSAPSWMRGERVVHLSVTGFCGQRGLANRAVPVALKTHLRNVA